MSQTSEILEFTHIDSSMFELEDGEFPDLITIVSLDEVDEVVKDTIARMLAFFHESPDVVKVAMAFASEVTDEEDPTKNIVLTSSMLVLILDYGGERKRMVILELARTKEHFTPH